MNNFHIAGRFSETYPHLFPTSCLDDHWKLVPDPHVTLQGQAGINNVYLIKQQNIYSSRETK